MKVLTENPDGVLMTPNWVFFSQDGHEVGEGEPIWTLRASLRTGTTCLRCHGDADEVPDTVKAALSAEFPGSRTLGYSEGEPIGMIMVSQGR